VTSRSGESGFSLVEMLISLALTGVVMAMTVPFAHIQKRLWERAEDRREAGRALAGALFWLTRDLQQAGYHASGPPLVEIAPDSLTYLVSRDEDDPAGFSAANRRQITFWLDGEDVKYRIRAPLPAPDSGWESGSTQILASGIASMLCRALDADGVETADATRAALVECTLSASSSGAQQRVLARLRGAGRGAGS
jgi:prepilin-type N-terminal cleavage/methylation domain-containing protein